MILPPKAQWGEELPRLNKQWISDADRCKEPRDGEDGQCLVTGQALTLVESELPAAIVRCRSGATYCSGRCLNLDSFDMM